MANKEKHEKHKRAILSMKWLFFWIAVALLFNAGVWYFLGAERGQEFLGGYLTELSLSIDNVFVFLMIFQSFKIDEHAQHRVLGWGICGAIVLRFIFIFFGVALVNAFEWILYIFGAFLVIQGARMVLPEKDEDPHDSFVMRTIGKIFPMTGGFRGEKFFVMEQGKRMITPLFAVLVLIETSDILFAVDSVPAVLGISTDLFVVYTSNIFAILGLRQLFFVIEHVSERFEYVKYGVALILVFTGVKMLLVIVDIHISTAISIGVIAGLLFVSILVSALISKRQEKC